ncbi:MAG: PQQ-like beta-propeller repeat protein [Fimbriimonadaceae bacterium]|nr:PQQ-like beta-propeller repeat protein [Fimbriimonadaceae bacterium]
MRPTRHIFAVCLAAVAVSASAGFDGPAPLAWRWVEPTSVSPSGAPIVQGDTIYAAVGRRMFAIDRLSGNTKWRYPVEAPLDGYFRNGCVENQGTLVANADNNTMYGVDAATGQSKWQFVSQFPFVGPPVAVSKFIVARLNNQTIIALDPVTGQAVWRDEQDQARPLRILGGISGPLAAWGSNVLLFTNSGELRAIDVSTQKIVWALPFSNVSAGTVPVVFGDMILVNSGTYLVAVDPVTGRSRWQTPVGEYLTFSPTPSPEGILVVGRTGNAMIVDRNGVLKGKPIALDSQPKAQPAAAGNLFIIPSANGSLNLLDPVTGKVIWTYFIKPLVTTPSSGVAGSPGPGAGGPSGLGGLGGARGGGLSGGGGQPNASTQATALSIPAAGAPVVAGDSLIVLGMDGSLLCFDKGFGVDFEGPTVEMVWPPAGAQLPGIPKNNQNPEFYFKIDDEAGGVKPSSIEVDIGGVKMTNEWARDGFAIVRISLLGKNKPVSDGRKVVTVKVSDWLGNTTTKSFAVFVDNSLPPLAKPGSLGPGGIGGPPTGGKGGTAGGVGG